MPEKMKALFRGATDANGVPLEWLDMEGSPDPSQPHEDAVPARHLTQEEYDALSPRNKQRVNEAQKAGGGPLYEVRSQADMKASDAPAKKDGE